MTMPGLTRAYFVVGAILILSIFYFSTSIHINARAHLAADERALTWEEADVLPPIPVDYHDPTLSDKTPGLAIEETVVQEAFPEVADSKLREVLNRQTEDQRHMAMEKVLLLEKQAYKIKAKSPYPNTVDPFAPAFRKEANVLPIYIPDADEITDSRFDQSWFAFQEDLPFSPPIIHYDRLTKYKPHNYQGPGRPAFATYLSTRNSSYHDPYFVAAQQMVYRLLWDVKSASTLYPVIVFVAPHIDHKQREMLQAAGAIVKELDLVPWDPIEKVWARWRDIFSKLHMWKETDFSKIAFLDLDAFPIANIDDIFDISPVSKCKKDLIPEEDKQYLPGICDYVFAGVQLKPNEEINTGVMVFKPEPGMHQRLLHNSLFTDRFDNKQAEQAFLNLMFAKDGPFPMKYIDRKWNGFYPQMDEEDKLRIVHEKLWAFGDLVPWTSDLFKDNWDSMVKFYESPMFKDLRAFDGTYY